MTLPPADPWGTQGGMICEGNTPRGATPTPQVAPLTEFSIEHGLMEARYEANKVDQGYSSCSGCGGARWVSMGPVGK